MPTLQRHAPVRPAILDLIAHAQTAGAGDPLTDERYFLDQLRAALAGGDRADDLRESYGAARPDPLGRIMARYRD